MNLAQLLARIFSTALAGVLCETFVVQQLSWLASGQVNSSLHMFFNWEGRLNPWNHRMLLWCVCARVFLQSGLAPVFLLESPALLHRFPCWTSAIKSSCLKESSYPIGGVPLKGLVQSLSHTHRFAFVLPSNMSVLPCARSPRGLACWPNGIPWPMRTRQVLFCWQFQSPELTFLSFFSSDSWTFRMSLR